MELNLSNLIINNKICNSGFIIMRKQLKKTKEILNKLEEDGYMKNYKYELKEFNEVFALRVFQRDNITVYDKVY